MSENQMFRNLAGIPPGKGERLRDGGNIFAGNYLKRCVCTFFSLVIVVSNPNHVLEIKIFLRLLCT